MSVRVCDLKNYSGKAIPPSLYCDHCGEAYSAEKGDYFSYPPTYVLTCCGEDMRLVVRKTIVEDYE